MRKHIAIVLICMLALVSPTLFAQEASERADELYDAERHEEGFEFLKSAVKAATSNSERAELYWRLARVTLEIGDLEELDGASTGDILARFVEGEGYADQSIELQPNNHEAYYWKSANIGRWGETKGILNSLFKARPMKDLLQTALSHYPGHAASFYVLGIMYRKVPGRPISFGNVNYAVSLARKSIVANQAEIDAGIEDEVKLTHYMELARNLWDRNWNISKRNREQPKKERQFGAKTDILEKHFYYEGTMDIPDMSDREEAIDVMEWVILQYEAKPDISDGDRVDLAEARVDLETWTK